MFNKVLLKTNIAVWFHIQTFFQNNKSTVKCLKRRYLQFGRTLTEICVQFGPSIRSNYEIEGTATFASCKNM